MRIAITGATGFVGRHVARACAARPELEVVVASRSLTAHAHGQLPSKVRHVLLDISTATSADYDRLGQPHVLLHLAWGGLPQYLSRHHFERELPAHYAFLRTMVMAGLPAMLVAGTCYEYGMINGELAEDRALQPANSYAFAKTSLLRQLQFLRDDSPFALTWARLFYLYGPGQAATSLQPALHAAIARGDEWFPMSAGEQLRDYLAVTDAATTITNLAIKARDFDTVNICSGTPISVRAIVERWIAEAGSIIKPQLGLYPYPKYEPFAFWGSTVKCRACLGD